MILDKEILIGVNGLNSAYYENKGYVIPRKKDSRGRVNFTKGTKIKVQVKDLMDGSKVKVKVECEICKKIRFVFYDSLKMRANSSFNKNGETLCTVCANHKMSGKNSGAYKHGSQRYPEYRYNAKKRNIDFNISIEFFKKITEKPCHYCGGYSIDNNLKSRGNGIDRKNSNIGYIESNCVPCCSRCNFLKNKMDYEEFIIHIKKIYDNLGLNKWI